MQTYMTCTTFFLPVIQRQQFTHGAYQRQITIVFSIELFLKKKREPVKLSLLCKHTNGAFSVITYTRQHISPLQLHFSLSDINKGENSQDVSDLEENNSTVLYN